MSISTPGSVVERASKEFSRRMHSLGFKSAQHSSSKEKPKILPSLSESDKLNGNNELLEAEKAGQEAAASAAPPPSKQADGGPASPGVVLRKKPVCAAAKQPAARASMSSIIKGSVMDKVTTVFNNGVTMGNANNSANKKAAELPTAQSSGPDLPISPVANVTTEAEKSGGGGGINIPKGAVANGRAKFESTPKASPEKPSRFFGSRSRTNSPMLPVKTPKVPISALKDLKSNLERKKSVNSDNENLPKQSATTTVMSSKPMPMVTFSSSKLLSKLKKFITWDELWQDKPFLHDFFCLFPNQNERAVLAQVCQKWREVLYQPEFWKEVRPVLHCRAIRSWSSASNCTSTATSSASNQSITNSSSINEVNSNSDSGDNREVTGALTSPSSTVSTNNIDQQMKANFFHSLKTRGFDTICLLNANDSDIFDFIQNFPHGATGIQSLILRCCNVSDRGLEAIMEFLQGLFKLEIAGCNEITEQGLWSSLHPRLASLTINDCINVADECVCAVTQLLPALYEFNLQAYHVTDSALSYFSPKQTGTLNILRLQSCWEITNHGIVNIVHTLPNLTVLSLSGCSKITDDGIELIAENLRKLRSLDLSWCPRVTDAALEYIACDLNHLEELTLDRCVHITDIGIGYISTMLALNTLYLRWCTQIRDFGLQHICGMRSMQILSLAGCPLLTSTGMSNLVQLRHLQELELTNCPGATSDLIEYLRTNLNKCLVLD